MAYIVPVIATGKPMGFYHDLAHYAVIAPAVCVFVVIAVSTTFSLEFPHGGCTKTSHGQSKQSTPCPLHPFNPNMKNILPSVWQEILILL